MKFYFEKFIRDSALVSSNRFVQVDDPATVRHGDELQLSMMANADALVEIDFRENLH